MRCAWQGGERGLACGVEGVNLAAVHVSVVAQAVSELVLIGTTSLEDGTSNDGVVRLASTEKAWVTFFV